MYLSPAKRISYSCNGATSSGGWSLVVRCFVVKTRRTLKGAACHPSRFPDAGCKCLLCCARPDLVLNATPHISHLWPVSSSSGGATTDTCSVLFLQAALQRFATHYFPVRWYLGKFRLVHATGSRHSSWSHPQGIERWQPIYCVHWSERPQNCLSFPPHRPTNRSQSAVLGFSSDRDVPSEDCAFVVSIKFEGKWRLLPDTWGSVWILPLQTDPVPSVRCSQAIVRPFQQVIRS